MNKTGPNPPDRKRRRGRPPVASKAPDGASSRQQPETNAHDAEDDSRPKKRGRKALETSATHSPSPNEQPAKIGRRGRPAKGKAQTTDDEDEVDGETKRTAAATRVKGNSGGPEAPADAGPPSSEARRSARERRAFNPDELYTAKQPHRSPTQFTSPPSDASLMPPPPRPPRRTRKAETAPTNSTPRRGEEAQPDPPSSTPRLSERERRAWDPEKLFSGSRQKEERQEDEPTTVVENGKARKQANALQQQGAAAKSRKRKPSAQNSVAEKVTASQEKVAAKKSRRQKPAAYDSTAEKANDTQEEAAALRTRKNKSKVQNDVAEKKSPNQAPQQESPDRVPSRSRKKRTAEPTETGDAPAADTTQLKRRGRKGPNDETRQEPEADEPSRSRGPRERKAKARVAQEQEQEPDQVPDPGPAKSKRKPPERQQPEPEVEQDSESESEEDDEDDEEMPFRYLIETIRNVPRSTITDKWTPLDPPAVNAVSAFFADVQRLVLLRLENTSQQRGHASAALGAITRRLQSRLVRGYPFPAPTASTSTRTNAGSHEDDFNFERMIDAKQTLEAALNPLLHSVSLLEKEISKEENALARDYDQLHTLEANAKSAAYEWRDKAKREHVLAPGIKKKGERDAERRDRLELVPAVEDGMSGGLFKDLEDQDLITLSQQIGSHMKSMKDNLQQIEGVVPAITESKAALQHVLLRHLDDGQYENVLLG